MDNSEDISTMDRTDLLKKYARLLPPADALVTACRSRGIRLQTNRSFGEEDDLACFVETQQGERQLICIPTTPREQHTSSAADQRVSTSQLLARVADTFRERTGKPADVNPLVEIVNAVGIAPRFVRSLLSSAPRTDEDLRDMAEMANHWESAERGQAALHDPGPFLGDPLAALRSSIQRPLGMVVAIVPDQRFYLQVKYECICHDRPPPSNWFMHNHGHNAIVKCPCRASTSLVHQGPVVFPVEHLATKTDNYSTIIVSAVLWLKAALRMGEVVELLDQNSGRRLVVTDLRGLVAEVTSWAVPSGPPVINVAIPLQHADRVSSPHSWATTAFTEIKVRYSEKTTYPKSMWLGSDGHLFRVDFGSPHGLLDWEPITAAEQAMIRADDANAAADDDDDDLGGQGGGYPSTTGRPSGGGRSNGPR